MKKYILLGFVFLQIMPLFGQQEIILTKYTYNSLFFNPAVAGRNGYGSGSTTLHYRNQWLNLDGAPKTLMANGEMSLFENRLGVGLNVAHEQIGVETRYDFAGNVCYRIEFDDSWLAGGIRAGWSQYKDDFSKLTIHDVGDIYDRNALNYGLLSLGAGAYFHKEDFYAGFAVPNLAVVAFSNQNIGSRSPHIYLHTGLMLGDEYSTVRLEPSMLFMYQRAAPIQVTLGINTWITKDLAIGAHYRTDDALALSAEFHFLDKLRVGAAYDFTMSDLRKYSDNSIEIFLGYLIQREVKNAKIRNIRHGGRF